MHAAQLAHLAHLAEQAAAVQPDLIAALAKVVKGVAASEADPYLIVGALIEALRIPLARRSATIRAIVALLVGQLCGLGWSEMARITCNETSAEMRERGRRYSALTR